MSESLVVTLGQQYHVGEKPTVIMYTYSNRHGGTPNKTATKDAMSLDYSSICYIGSRVILMSMKEIYNKILLYININSHGCRKEHTYNASSTHGVENKLNCESGRRKLFGLIRV